MHQESERAEPAQMRLERKHLLAIRWMHWINFPVLLIMILSGIRIYWNTTDNAHLHPHAVYRIGFGSHTLLRIFPEPVWNALHVPWHVTQGLGDHFFFMWIFAINGVAYVFYTVLSGEWRYIVPRRESFREGLQALLAAMRLRKGPARTSKYNGAQRIAYTAVIAMGTGSLFTGLAIYKPTQLHLLTAALGGYEAARWEHFWLTIGFCLFFVVHVLQVVLAGWNNFRSMLTGIEVRTADQPLLDETRSSSTSRSEGGPSAVETQNAMVTSAVRKHTRRSFAITAVAAVAGYEFCRWVFYGKAEGDQPLARRRAFQANAALSRSLFADRALAPTYPISRAETPRINGEIGLKQELIAETWRLQLVGAEIGARPDRHVDDVTEWDYRYLPNPNSAQASQAQVGTEAPRPVRAGKLLRGVEEAGPSQSTLPAKTPGLLLTMDDILKLPRHELVTEFKCIEGWSQIIHWAGFRMADFMEAYPPARKPDGSMPRYVYMETPNGDYYVGYDLDVCRHPQTLLVTHMDGKPLTRLHGAPLRLHAPTKYGYKQIKCIGLIAYTDIKPDDYWTKLGYDWYAGL